MIGPRKNRLILGDYNVISDRSGQKLKRSQCRYTWDGFLVGIDEWEAKQPQIDIKVRAEQIAVPDSRPRGPLKFESTGVNYDFQDSDNYSFENGFNYEFN